MSSSLVAIRTATEAGTAEQKRLIEKKRNILILINQYLIECGYFETAERLQHEAGPTISKFEVADNINLSLILQDYEAYYEMRFDRKAKLVRKLADDAPNTIPRPPKVTNDTSKKSVARAKSGENSAKESSTTPKLPNVPGASPASEENNDFSISGSSFGQEKNIDKKSVNADSDTDIDRVENRVLKPPPSFGLDADMRQIANIISREIYQDSPNVRFDDIVQLDEAKRLLCEAVQLPLKFPSIFTGLLRPWKGILLHGPPGTGKTMLAKAVATECRTTFFNISASTLVSKWRGDSEKLVRVLFELARYHAPSTIFLDEMDSILSARGGDGAGEHEASRRMKTELLIQMDGLRGGKAGEQVFVMAASNLPWDLDMAVLRRLEKRVMVPLPEVEAREAMIRQHLKGREVESLNYLEFAQQTPGYSGADLELLCREAAMKPVRRLMAKLQQEPSVESSAAPGAGLKSNAKKSLWNANSIDCAAAIESILKADPLTMADFLEALKTTRPSSDMSLSAKYEAWQEEFGSV